jgi:alpha-galactosidase/6-phospho-beta-glucosidase family protein
LAKTNSTAKNNKKKSVKKEQKEESSAKPAIISGEYIVSLIESVTTDAQEKVLLEDNVKGIIREAETLSSYIHEMPHGKRKKLLLAYSKVLEEIKNSIDNMVKELE